MRGIRSIAIDETLVALLAAKREKYLRLFAETSQTAILPTCRS